jgi:hypothetical protein
VDQDHHGSENKNQNPDKIMRIRNIVSQYAGSRGSKRHRIRIRNTEITVLPLGWIRIRINNPDPYQNKRLDPDLLRIRKMEHAYQLHVQ